MATGKAVVGVIEVMIIHRHALLAQQFRERDALVPQGVILGGYQQGGRQVGGVVGTQGKGPLQSGIVRGLAPQVVVPEPLQQAGGERLPRGFFRIGGPCHTVVVGGGVDQHRADELVPCALCQLQAGAAGQVAAGAVSGDDQLAVAGGQLGGALRYPGGGGQAIVLGGGKGVLRRQPVIQRDHRTTAVVRQGAAEGMVALQVPDHPATAMDVQDQRPVGSQRVDIEPGADGDVTHRYAHIEVRHAAAVPAPVPGTLEPVEPAQAPDFQGLQQAGEPVYGGVQHISGAPAGTGAADCRASV